MLQIRIHAHNAITLSIINPCNHGCLMAKISGKTYHLNMIILSSKV